jgi:hypothetical protein
MMVLVVSAARDIGLAPGIRCARILGRSVARVL